MPGSTIDVRPIPDSIHGSCLLFPQSIALTFGNKELNYAELDLRSRQLAAYLTQLGVAPGDSVAICMERSFDWIVAALATMYAGAAYVPLDLAWPDSRVRFAIDDSAATVLISTKSLFDRLCADGLNVDILNVDPARDAAVIAAQSAPADIAIEPEGLAYIIYTSGSTGTPKGTEITHSNLAHLVRWHLEAFDVTPADRASHLAGLGFDAAVWEVWPCLSAGATLCLAEDAVRSSPELIQKWMVQERVTIGFVPTVHATPLIDMPWPEAASLRYLLTGGDALRHAPRVALPFTFVNNYGPTECTVVTTSGTIKPGYDGVPSIGGPIAGTSVYLLDQDRQQVPDGVAGEIYVGGGGVARGYRNRPEATAHSFLPDPFAKTPGSRMYRTGDRGVRRPDGQIEFRGRLDRQTKIRGQRVELDEVGAALESYRDLAFSTVIAAVSETGDNQLVAYVVIKEGAQIDSAHELQKHLQASLPDYMIPRLFVKLDRIPVSANGKVDLTILPPPADSNLLRRLASRTTGTPTEEKLLKIIRELLHNDSVTLEDNFFLAGGHSLLGMQLVIMLRNAFHVDLPLRKIFEASSVEALAELVDTTTRQNRLTAIWSDLLGRNHIGLDDNCFEMDGRPDLCADLQTRIREEFGRKFLAIELLQNPTIRQQVKLISASRPENIQLPPGVTALQPDGNSSSFFWIQDLSLGLAKEIGETRPFLSVGFTDDDFVSLGAAPPLEKIATCLAAKIRISQPAGPYLIGGMCLAGILALEIATQLRSSGDEVSLLVLLDPPNPWHLGNGNPLTPRLSQPRYLFSRIAKLGPATSLRYLKEHLSKRFTRATGINKSKDALNIAQNMIEVAAADYVPKDYKGDTILFLSTVRPPHLDFLPGWKAVLSGVLSVIHVEAHHRDMLELPSLTTVAKSILSHIGLPGLSVAVENKTTDTEKSCTCDRHDKPVSTTLADLPALQG